MLLAIDIGNTRTVIGVYSGGSESNPGEGARLAHDFKISSDRHRTADELGVLVREMLFELGVDAKDVLAAVMSSVVPPLNRIFTEMCEKRFDTTPLVIGPGVKTGMPVRYESPKDVGADRIVNGVAGYELFCRSNPTDDEGSNPPGVIVVDFGTATTFDVVSPKGEYLGGAIAPGVQISTEALFLHASKLPRVDLVMPASALGKTTVESMQSGILYGYLGLVDALVERLRAEVGFPVRVVATGGIAALMGPHSQSIEMVDEFLTLEGLRIIFSRNEYKARP